MQAHGERFGISPLNGYTADLAQTEVTFVCADVVRFTSMTQALGDRASLCLMRRIARLVQAEAKARGGRTVEVRGDSFLLALPRRKDAIGCARDIHAALERDAAEHADGGVQVRIAVHAGPVLQMNEHYFGLNVILPYRLLPLLRAGETAVTEGIASGLGERRTCHPKGFRDTVAFFVLQHVPAPCRTRHVLSPAHTPERAPERRQRWLKPLPYARIDL